MALRRIRCIGMTDDDMKAAEQILKDRPLFERCGLNITSLAEDKDIQLLREKGLIVEVPPDSNLAIGWLEPDEKQEHATALSNEALDSPQQYVSLAKASPEYYVIQFKGALDKDQRRELANLEVRLGGYVPDFAYKAALSPTQTAAVQDLGYVQRVVHYSPALTLRRVRKLAETAISEPELAFAVGGFSPPYDEEVMYNIKCHDSDDLPALSQALSKDARIQRVEQGRSRIRIWTKQSVAETLRNELARLPQISVVEPFEYPAPMCQFVRQAIGINSLTTPPLLPWHGEGQVVGVADSGIDTQHPDLKNQLKKLIERVTPEDSDDPFGHGSHVCSIIAGDGTASGGVVQGISPGAKLVVQGIRDKDGIFSGVPVDMANLFQEAFDEGVRIHNNSWGSAGAGLYTTDAYELDQFVFEHPEFLIVVAAGNEGQQPNPLDPVDPLGRIGYSSIASPATSKNSLTVGACCSPRPDGPYRGTPWKDYQGRLPSPQFPPVADEPISGDPKFLAAFSSRGPTDDTRVKPDLVVPGTAILAAKSSPSTPRYPEAGFGGHYAYQSGTSMAAPVATGAAAIVRQYYLTERHHATPSAALLKATLINGCEWIPTDTAQDPNAGEPNFHQGFGRLNMKITLPAPGDPSGFSLRFVDVNNGDPLALDSTKTANSAWRKQIQVKDNLPLRITLCWTDYPAHGLQNHLDLILQSPANVREVGNPKLVRGPWAKTDRFNNVQRIVIGNPTAGTWLVVVNASNTPFPVQGFSLVATGKELSDFF